MSRFVTKAFSTTVLIALLLLPFCFTIMAQQKGRQASGSASSRTSNYCGVTAIISPGNDTVKADGQPITYSSASLNATTYTWIVSGYAQLTDQPIMVGHAPGITEIKLVASNGDCHDTATTYYFYPGTFPPDTNNTKLNYGLPGVNVYTSGFISLRNGGYLIAGDRNQNSWMNLPQRGFLFKAKPSGCIEWAKMVESPFISDVVELAEASDGSLYALGHTEYSSPFILKLDPSGNTIWSKQITDAGGNRFNTVSLYATNDGGMIVTGAATSAALFVVIRLNAAGNIVWQRHFEKSVFNANLMRYMLQKDDALYVSGNLSYMDNGNLLFPAFILKLNYATGQMIWTKKYNTTGGEISIHGLHSMDTLIVVNALAYSGVSNIYTVTSLINLDTAGNVIDAVTIGQTDEYYAGHTQLVPISGNRYYALSVGNKPLPLQPYVSYQTKLVKLDSSFNVIWGRHQAAINLGTYGRAAVGENENLVIAGNEFGQGYLRLTSWADKITIKKIDTLGGDLNNGCYFMDWPMIRQPITIFQHPETWNIESSATNSIGNYAAPLIDIYPELYYKCPDYIDSCSMLQVSGPQFIPCLDQAFTYKAHKNSGCGQPVNWLVTGGANIITQNDSSISLSFPAYGRYVLYGTAPFGCTPLQDSIVIFAEDKWPSLNLGADTSLCPGNTYTIHAGSTFFSYTWHDGSTDSTFTAGGPGLYWVEVADSCGTIYRDTVEIFARATIPFSVGADRTICINDTVHIQAPPGFMNYSWQPDYGIIDPNAQTVIVKPLVDTTYTVMAEKTPGCFAFDTIHITVMTAPQIDLGADTSFCQGGSKVLDAGPGFDTYSWSNGLNTQQIAVSIPGTYMVTGTTAQGCEAGDIFQVVNVWPLPVVTLDDNPVLCTGTSRLLDAGPGMAIYTWNTGSTSQGITVSATGLYAVSVTDQHGCEKADTVEITSIAQPPASFLPPDTTLCSYGSMALKTIHPYNSYLWSNGSTSPVITVSQAGMYWLQVRDANNCEGRDSIIISPKDCLTGFYIPNAFTPDNSGKNDTFKPFLFGNIKQYHFAVYNRYGELIWQTTTPGQGWDGTYGGKKQDSNLFVWTCTWQFDGEAVKKEKGTVMLIR